MPAREEVEEPEGPVKALDEGDIALLKTYGVGPYTKSIKTVEEDIKKISKHVNEICGIKESDTGLAQPSQWDLVADRQMMQEEQPLQEMRDMLMQFTTLVNNEVEACEQGKIHQFWLRDALATTKWVDKVDVILKSMLDADQQSRANFLVSAVHNLKSHRALQPQISNIIKR